MNSIPRHIQKKFRVSEQEDILLQEKLRSSGLSLQDYLLKASLGRKIKPFPEGFDVRLQEIYRSLRNIQGNLNQTARTLNYGNIVPQEEIQSVLHQVMISAADVHDFLVSMRDHS